MAKLAFQLENEKLKQTAMKTAQILRCAFSIDHAIQPEQCQYILEHFLDEDAFTAEEKDIQILALTLAGVSRQATVPD